MLCAYSNCPLLSTIQNIILLHSCDVWNIMNNWKLPKQNSSSTMVSEKSIHYIVEYIPLQKYSYSHRNGFLCAILPWGKTSILYLLFPCTNWPKEAYCLKYCLKAILVSYSFHWESFSAQTLGYSIVICFIYCFVLFYNDRKILSLQLLRIYWKYILEIKTLSAK